MGLSKTSGQFGYVQKGKSKSGEVVRKIYVTKDINLVQGQTIYLNDLEESLQKKVELGIIKSEAEASQQLSAIRQRDEEFGRETTFVCRAMEPANKDS